jgi:hypothetical protein
MTAYRAAALLCLLAACKGTPAPAKTSAASSAAGDSSSAMIPTPETHLFDLADSTEVWLVTGREGHGSGGTTCIEHGVQLRKGPFKMQVPLLYVTTLPEVVNGKLVAKLSTDCVTKGTYVIDPKTAQPTLMAPAAR